MRLLGACSLLTLGLVGANFAHAQPVPGYGMPPYGAPGYPLTYGPPAGYYNPGYAPPGYFAAPPGYTPGYPAFTPPGAYYPATPVPGGAVVLPSPAASSSGVPITTGDAGQGAGSALGAPPKTPAGSEVLPSPGGFIYDDGTDEPMVQLIGPSKPGLFPQSRWSVPERPGQEHIWFGLAYLAGFPRGERYATPLVTTGSTLDPRPGALGQRGTAVLFGAEHGDFGLVSGVRGEAGFFLGGGQCWSLDWAGFYYFPSHVRFSAISDGAGNPVIARPIFDVVNGIERAFIDSFPGSAAGAATIDNRLEFFGTELNLRYRCEPAGCFHLDFLFGFRYLHLDEDLFINDALQPLAGNVGGFRFKGQFLTGSDVLTDNDTFRTRNDFYGGQFGLRSRLEWDHFFIGGFSKFALGATTETVEIAGSTTRSNAGGISTAVGGILALPPNIGTHTRTVFGFVPELGLEAGLRLTTHIRLTAGYTFLAWTSVTRPGNELNRAINRAFVPSDNTFGAGGPAAPVFRFNSETFWMHTLSLGLDFTY